MILKAQEINVKINKCRYIKLKRFFLGQLGVGNQQLRQFTECKNMFEKYVSDKGSMAKIPEEQILLNSKKANSLIEKWAKQFNIQYDHNQRVRDNICIYITEVHILHII